MKQENRLVIQEAVIVSKIVTIREEKVILDVHLAELYKIGYRKLRYPIYNLHFCNIITIKYEKNRT